MKTLAAVVLMILVSGCHSPAHNRAKFVREHHCVKFSHSDGFSSYNASTDTISKQGPYTAYICPNITDNIYIDDDEEQP